MILTMTTCKHRLAALWFGVAGVLFFILLFQTILGRFGTRASDAWNWWLPTIMPTLSLVIGVLVKDALTNVMSDMKVDSFLFWLTFGISAAYLTAVLSLFLFQPFTEVGPFELMGQSKLWLSPFQWLVAGSMGAFFVNAPPQKGKDVKSKSKQATPARGSDAKQGKGASEELTT
ncbi:MAG: hypothetical protein ACLQPD_33545 [Desulfomonilaceae bacterium]